MTKLLKLQILEQDVRLIAADVLKRVRRSRRYDGLYTSDIYVMVDAIGTCKTLACDDQSVYQEVYKDLAFMFTRFVRRYNPTIRIP